MAFGALLSTQSAGLRHTINTELHNIRDQVRSTSSSFFTQNTQSRIACLWCDGHQKCRKESKRHATGHFINYSCPVAGCSHTTSRRDHFITHLDKQHIINNQKPLELQRPRSALLLSASIAVNDWRALGCGICGKLFQLEDRQAVPESHATRIEKVQSEYVNHCLAHLTHGKKTRADWSDTKRILSLLQQRRIYAEWIRFLRPWNIDHETCQWKWEGGRTAEFIAMLERGDMGLGPGKTYHDDALSLVTLIDAGRPRDIVNTAVTPPQTAESGGVTEFSPHLSSVALINRDAGASIDAPGSSNSDSLESSRMMSGHSSRASDRLDDATLVDSRSISPVTMATRVNASIVHASMLDDQMYFSESGLSPDFGSPRSEVKLYDASHSLAHLHSSLPATINRLDATERWTHAQHNQATASSSAYHPRQGSPAVQPALAHLQQGVNTARAARVVHQPPAGDSEYSRKKRPVSFTKQIKRRSREISAIFSTRRNVHDMLLERP